MKLIKPSFEILEQGEGITGIYKQIEIAGRTCYKSEDKITEDSAKKFVNTMVKSGHGAMLEHGTVYLALPFTDHDVSNSCNGDVVESFEIAHKYGENQYSRVAMSFDKRDIKQNPFRTPMGEDKVAYYYVTTNYRHLVENGWLDDLKYLCKPTEFHEKRVTVRFTADIHFYKDITRHRLFSWAIESTRYCNYLKEKFGMSVSFMQPTWIKEKDISELEEDCKVMESIYFKWINKGYQAQHAAYFLPQGTKAEVIMTGFVSDYNHFFDLRAKGITGTPHPDVLALAKPLMQEFIKRNYL